jgi:hypothetical protein
MTYGIASRQVRGNGPSGPCMGGCDGDDGGWVASSAGISGFYTMDSGALVLVASCYPHFIRLRTHWPGPARRARNLGVWLRRFLTSPALTKCRSYVRCTLTMFMLCSTIDRCPIRIGTTRKTDPSQFMAALWKVRHLCTRAEHVRMTVPGSPVLVQAIMSAIDDYASAKPATASTFGISRIVLVKVPSTLRQPSRHFQHPSFGL